MGPALLVVLLAGAPPSDLALVGYVSSGDPARQVALVRSGGRTRAVARGELAFGGRLLEIGDGRARLDFDGQQVELILAGDARPAAVASAPPIADAAPPPAAGLVENAIQQEKGRTLSRADVDRRLANEMPRILTETALRPYTEDGKVAGFMLSRVPEGTLLSDVGLRAGDVLTSINDTPIDGLPTLLGLWTSLQTADHLTAVVLRDGRRQTLAVRFQ